LMQKIMHEEKHRNSRPGTGGQHQPF
jgi:hypothetical protein